MLPASRLALGSFSGANRYQVEMTKCRTIALPPLRHSGFALLSLFSIRLAHRRKRDHWAVATVLWTVKSQLQKKYEKT
jgi:hypothetical protein